jgi:competence protein ComEA
MFKKTLIFLLVFGLMATANAAGFGKFAHHSSKKTVTTKIADHSVNLNQADVQKIAAVKGLGPKKAEAIIAYRKANGKFKSIDDLTKVKGIGDKRLAKIKQYLTV